MIGSIPNVIMKTAGTTRYYFGTIGSDKIRNLTFVPVIEISKKTFINEDSSNGYQRPASITRMRAFMKYLKGEPNRVVPPVLLSGRGSWKFVASSADSSFGRLDVENPAAIIDGQHRLGGYVFLFEEDEDVREISFIVLDGLNLEEETQEFVIVNNSQKGVPKSLTSFLGDSEEAQIAWSLNVEADSPFKGRITRTATERQHLFALHSVAKQIKRFFGLGALQDLDVETKVEYTSRFWGIVADCLTDEWADIERLDDEESRGRNDFKYKLLELTGLIAWSICGAQILFRSYSEATGMNWDNVKRLVESAAPIDWDKTGQYAGRTGEAGGKLIADDMLRLLPPEVGS